MTSFFLSSFAPLLLVMLLFQKIINRTGTFFFLIGILCSALILRIPFHGLPIVRWIATFSENWSIALVSILAVSVLENYFSQTIFSSSDWKTIWLFGAVMSFLLYPSALGLGSFDVYSFGWHSNILFFGMIAVALYCFEKRKRFGVIILLSLVTWKLHLQISTNLWDYLIDPFYGVISLIIVFCWGIRSIKRS